MRLDHIPDISKMAGLLRTYNQWRRGETVSAAIDEVSKLWNTRTGSKGDE